METETPALPFEVIPLGLRHAGLRAVWRKFGLPLLMLNLL